MAEKFKIEITTPGKLVYRSEVEMATIPGEEIYSNANDNNSIESRIFVAGGFAEVNDKETSVLATEAYDLSQITKDEVNKKIEAATVKLNTAENDFEKRIAQEAIDINQQILSHLN